jgi:hypothetical protein
VKEQANPAGHPDAIAERWLESPVAGSLDRSAVERRRHTMGKPHLRDVPLRVDIDIHRDIATHAAGNNF